MSNTIIIVAPSEAPLAHEQRRGNILRDFASIIFRGYFTRIIFTESGFKKVYSLDMTNSRQRCPSGFKLNTYGSRRLCGRAFDRSGCVSIAVRVHGKKYNQVRGRVIAYQYASPDAFHSGSTSINGVYVDGISITYDSPRKHVWTLGASLFSYSKSSVTCPGTGYGRPQPAFVGNNYFCTSGNFGSGWQYKLYDDVPLWSTVTGNCGNCKDGYDVPYFCTQLTKSTNKDLEIRLCGNQGTRDEDIKIESIELYIK